MLPSVCVVWKGKRLLLIMIEFHNSKGKGEKILHDFYFYRNIDNDTKQLHLNVHDNTDASRCSEITFRYCQLIAAFYKD